MTTPNAIVDTFIPLTTTTQLPTTTNRPYTVNAPRFSIRRTRRRSLFLFSFFLFLFFFFRRIIQVRENWKFITRALLPRPILFRRIGRGERDVISRFLQAEPISTGPSCPPCVDRNSIGVYSASTRSTIERIGIYTARNFRRETRR